MQFQQGGGGQPGNKLKVSLGLAPLHPHPQNNVVTNADDDERQKKDLDCCAVQLCERGEGVGGQSKAD